MAKTLIKVTAATRIRKYLASCKNPRTPNEIARATKSNLKTVRNNLGIMLGEDSSETVQSYDTKRKCAVTGKMATTYSL